MKNLLLGGFLMLACTPAIAQIPLFDRVLPAQEVPANLRLQQNDARHYLGTRYAKQTLALAETDYVIYLRDDWQVHSRFVKMHRYAAGSYAYEGVLQEPDQGHVVLSAYADRIAGMITFDDGRRFMIDQPADGVFAISQTAEAAFSAQEALNDFVEMKDPMSGLSTMANADVCATTNTCPSASVIDLMVVYTQAAETAWGGQANTVANITTAVTNMNTSMTNSGINNVSFRLVHTAKVNYTESGNFSTDLSRLGGTADGYIDEVHALRDQYGADLVSMITGSPTSACGIGYLNTSATNYSATSAFNVSLYSCVVGNYTMAHEFGHNMGLRHDFYVDVSSTPCAHHHGYVNQNAIQLGATSTSAQRWRTIMAYNNQCADAGFNCTRLNRWSNPQLTYNGDAMGRAIGNTQPSDEAYAYYRMACVVAGFRSEANGCATPSGLSTSGITTNTATLSWAAVSGATSYDVEYKTSAASAWTTAAAGATGTSINLSSLAAATTYNWRVKANCSGGSSSYATASFTTNALCGTPAGLNSSSVTTSSATLSWNAVSNALSYIVEIKTSAASSWTPLATGITTTSANAGGLQPGTAYNWRVLATCADGNGAWATANFNTTAVACADPYESNNSRTAATAINTGTNVNGLISTSSDNDYFKFSNSSASPNIRVTLSNLPANYNIELYRTGVNKRVAISANSGTTSETITLNNAVVGQYEIRVYGNSRNEFNATQCYTLRADIGSTAFDQADNDKPEWTFANSDGITVYPVPARGTINIAFESKENGPVQLSLMNQTGVTLQHKSMQVARGINVLSLPTGSTPSGMYILKLLQGSDVRTSKVLIQH